MSRLQDTAEVKALFRQLVKAAGGVEACSVELGISFQRISHLQNTSNGDEPTYRQIRTLEVLIGKTIVTGAHGEAVNGDGSECIKAAVVDAVTATAQVLSAVHVMDADGHRDEGEIRSVQAAAVHALAQAQEAVEASGRLTAGPVH